MRSLFELFALDTAAIEVDQTIDQRGGGLQPPRRIAAGGLRDVLAETGRRCPPPIPARAACGNRQRRADRARRRGRTRPRPPSATARRALPGRGTSACRSATLRRSAVCVNPRLVMPSAPSRAGTSSDALPKSATLICGVPSGVDATRMLAGLRSLCRRSSSCAAATARAMSTRSFKRRSNGTRPSPPCASAHSARFEARVFAFDEIRMACRSSTPVPARTQDARRVTRGAGGRR